MKWNEITPDFLQFTTKGESVEGKLLGCTELRIKDVPVRKWSVARLSDGIAVGFLGGVSLDPMLDAVPIGTVIKLEFDGMVQLAAGHRVKKFKLYQGVQEAPKAETKK